MADLSDVDKAVASRPRLAADAAGLVAGLVTVVAWGSAFVGIRAAGHALSPGSIALGRLIVSCAILVPVAVMRREPLPARRDVVQIAVYGVLWLAIYSTTLNAAERSVDAGTAAMLVNTGPILIAILAGLFLHEGFPRRLFAGCAIAFAGAVLIGFAGTHSGTASRFGIVLCVVAALAYAVAVVVQKPALKRVSSFQVTWIGVVAAAVACLPFAPHLAAEAPTAGVSAIAWTIYLGAVPTALGFATWSYALRRTSAGRTASLNYLIPVVAIVLGWALLGEAPPALALVGGTLCIAGVYVARRQ
ncbi:MAG TPA: DMT family transporter [Candidatus Dormibacteraeota bacterium]|nr:DMT family transporter [Candidatus Dormibacteraeota bacterium]